MKLAVKLICVAVLFISSVLCNTDLDQYCYDEVTNRITEVCVVTASNDELLSALSEYQDKNITRDAFKQFYDDYCIRTANYRNCVIGLTEQCKSYQEIKEIYDESKFYQILAKYYCDNDGERQMAVIEGDGLTCLLNENYLDCFYDTVELLSPTSICDLVNGTRSCDNHLDVCTNKLVKQYRAELFRNMLVEMDCSNE